MYLVDENNLNESLKFRGSLNIFGSSSSPAPTSTQNMTLGETLQGDRSLCTDRKKLQGILKDFYPKKNKQRNLLLLAFDEGVVGKAMKADNLDEATFGKLYTKIQKDFGVGEEDAKWAVIEWYNIFEKEINVSMNTVPSLQPSSAPQSKASPSVTATPAAQALGQVAVVSTAPVAELIELYKAAASERYKRNKSQFQSWVFVSTTTTPNYLPRQFSDVEKKMVLRTICKNKYQEKDVVHACINEDMSGGFVLTAQAICLFAKPCFYQDDGDNKPNFIIPYPDIKCVETAYLRILLKDENIIRYDGQYGYWNEGCWTFNKELSTYLNALAE